MQMTELPLRSLDLPRLSRLVALRKFVPDLSRAGPRNDACAEIERLALASPHLLPDLGFEEVRAASGAQRRVWRRGAFVVTIRPAAEPCGRLRVDVRRAPV